MKKVLLWGRSWNDPASRFRLVQMVEPLRREGYSVRYVRPFPDGNWKCRHRLPRAIFWGYTYLVRAVMVMSALVLAVRAAFHDVVFLNRDILPFFKKPWLEKVLKTLNPALVFDFDDAIYLNSPAEKIGAICAMARLNTPGNDVLAGFARKHSERVTVFPTVVDTDKIRPKEKKLLEGGIVGWTGSDDSYGHCMTPRVREMLAKISREKGCRILIMKQNPPPAEEWAGADLVGIPWSGENEGIYIGEIGIGLMPLEDSEFERGKCGLKLLQYMAAGVPVIASPVGVNSEIVVEGVTGFLCAGEEQWISRIEQLLADPGLRAEMGRNGRRRCEEMYSVRSLIPRMKEAIERCSK